MYHENRNCSFNFKISVLDEVKKNKKTLLILKNGIQSGLDSLDGTFVRLIAEFITEPVSQIFNLSVKESVFLQAWKLFKIIPISKSCRSMFNWMNSRPINILPALSKLIERLVLDQSLKGFSVNGLDPDFQHVSKKVTEPLQP